MVWPVNTLVVEVLCELVALTDVLPVMPKTPRTETNSRRTGLIRDTLIAAPLFWLRLDGPDWPFIRPHCSLLQLGLPSVQANNTSRFFERSEDQAGQSAETPSARRTRRV
jgi:hypothetical protein